MTRILVPTDFSYAANKAFDYALCLAKKYGAEIALVHACELMHRAFKDHTELIDEYNSAIQASAGTQLDLLQKSITDTEPVVVTTHIYDGGTIDAILHAATATRAHLIVMGTLGRTGLRNKIFGSRTAELLAESNVPVITIPYAYEWAEPRRILIALNNPTENLRVLQPVFKMAERYQSDVRVAIFSATTDEGMVVMEHSRSIESIQQNLQKMYGQTFVKTVHLGGTDFATAIQEYITANDITLLAMITHYHRKAQPLFHRSITQMMDYHTTIPLLSVHAGA